jgi:hypothetical protein
LKRKLKPKDFARGHTFESISQFVATPRLIQRRGLKGIMPPSAPVTMEFKPEHVEYQEPLSAIALLGHERSCGCLGCELMRAGSCPACAADIVAAVNAKGEPGEMQAQACSDACDAAIRHVFRK